jgi:Na+/melibiose symporter-like transporter
MGSPSKSPDLQKKYLNSWALGSVGGGASEAFLSMFLLYFYNQVLGLDPFLCGLGIALSLFVDAFSDPMIGGLSDRTQSRFGRRIPYMALGLFGFALGIFLLFNARLGDSQIALFIQLLLFIIITRISSTMFFIPRSSLGVEMIKGYEQRNLLHARDNNFGILGTVIFYSSIAIIFGNNWNQESGYEAVSLIVVCLFLITSIYSVFKLRNVESLFEKTSVEDRTQQTGVLKGLSMLWKNDSWRNLIIGTSLFGIVGSLSSVFSIYMINFFWLWLPDEFTLILALSIPGAMIAGLSANKLLENKDKKKTVLILTCILITIGPSLTILRILDIRLDTNILPEVGLGIYSLLFVIVALHSSFMAGVRVINGVVFSSMFSDVVEDHQKNTQSRSEGLIISVNGLSGKILGGVGILLSGTLLSLVGFGEEGSLEDKREAVTSLAIFSTALLYVIAPVSLFFISKYKINKSIHEDNLQDLGYKTGRVEL